MLNTFMREVNEKFQLVPPHIDRRNSAERAIWTSKDNFIAGISITHKELTLHIRCQLHPHASIILNLLWKSCMNPKLSGNARLHGGFNNNSTPLAPPGAHVIIHEKPTVRGTWASHGVKGWYLGPSMNQYKCHCVYVTKKKDSATQIALNFPHTIIHSPTILPQKMSSLRHMHYPTPWRTQRPKRHFTTSTTLK